MRKFYLLILVLSVFTGSTLKAQWTQTSGPIGGIVNCLTTDGTNLYAGTKLSGIYLSTNNGGSWTAVNSGLTSPSVNSILIKGDTVFTGTGSGLYYSINNGTHWTFINSNVQAMALVVSGTTIFAGVAGSGVYKSTNNGATWALSNTGLSNLLVSTMVVSGTNIYAGTYSGGVFLSTNNGGTWTAVNTGITTMDVRSLTAKGSNVFAGTYGGGVFLTTNNGGLWTAMNTGLTNLNVFAFAINGTDIFAGTWSSGVFKSTNNGTSWTAVNTGISGEYVTSIAMMGVNIFIGTYFDCVFLSTTYGVSWIPSNNGLITTDVRALAFSGTTNLFAGTEGDKAFLTSSNGASWSLVNNGITSVYIESFAISGNNIFAGATGGGAGVYLSTNTGASWAQVNTGLTNTNVSSLAIIGTTTLVGTTGGGIFVSANNGTLWTASNTGLTNLTVNALIVSGSNVFAGTNGGVFLSVNNGATWAPVNTGLTTLTVWAFAVSGSNIYAGTFGGGVFLSTNNGTNWTPKISGLSNSGILSLAASGSNVFAGTFGGVFLSSNNATSWSDVSANLPNYRAYSLAISGNNVFVGTQGGGVWKRPLDELVCSLNPPVMSSLSSTSVCSGQTKNIPLTNTGVAANYTWIASDNPQTTGESTTLQSTSMISNALVNSSNLSATNVIYTVTPTAISGGCVGTPQTVTYTVNPSPIMTSNSTVSVCSGQSVGLAFTSSVASSYSWIASDNPNTSGESITTKLLSTLNDVIINNSLVPQTVTYTVTPTSSVGICAGISQTVTVTVNPTPTMTSVSSATICSGETVDIHLTSSVPSTHTWIAADNTNTTGESIFLRPQSVLSNTIENNTTVAQPVIYTVTPTAIVGGCSGTQTFTVTVNPAPTMTSSAAASICGGGTVTINLTSDIPSSYSWNASDNLNTTGESINPQSTNTLTNTIMNNSHFAQIVYYSVTPTSSSGSCAGAPQSVAVTVNPLPAMTSTSSATICSGGTVSIPLIANISSAFSWIAADNTSTTGESITSQSTSTLSNTITNNTNTSQNVIYTVTPTATILGSCTGTPQTVTVSVDPKPTMSSASTATICSGGTVNILLTSSVASSYTWIAADNVNTTGESIGLRSTGVLSNIIVNNSLVPQNVVYTVIPTSTSGGCVGPSQTVTVTVNPSPNMTSASTATICSGGTATFPLTSDVASSYTWIATDNPNTTGESITSQSTGTLNNTITNSSTLALNVVYTITPTSTTGSCAGTSQTATVTVNPTPTMTSSNSATICSGGTVNIPLTSNIVSSYSWIATNNTNTTGESITSQSTSTLNNTITNNSAAAQNVVYTVTPTATLGTCAGTAQTVTVTVNPSPTMTSAAAATICSNGTVNVSLTSNLTSSYSWVANDNANTSGESTSSQSSGTLSNTITNNSAVAQNVVYTVTPTSTSGSCAGSAQTVTVTVNPAPTMTSTTAVTICGGGAVNIPLTSNIVSSFSWIATDNPNTTGESITSQSTGTLNNTITNFSTYAQNVIYTVTPTSTTGSCAGASQTVTIIVNPVPSMTSSNAATICSGATVSISLTGNIPSSYTWIAADNANTTGESITSQATAILNNSISNSSTVAQNVIYTVTPVATFGGCSGSSQTVTVIVNPNPTMTSATAATICSNGTVSVSLTSNLASSYTWVATDNANTSGESTSSQSNGTLSNIITNNSAVVQNVIYAVTPTSTSGGCVGLMQTVIVTVNPAPIMTSTTTTSICSGGTVNIPLTSNIASSYSWIAADNPNTTGESTTTQSTGTLNNTITNFSSYAWNVIYTVTPTSTAGTCAGSAQTVTVAVNPVPVMTSTNAASACSGGTISFSLTATLPSSYTWMAADNANTTGESTTSQSTSILNNSITNNSTVTQNVIYTVIPTSTFSSCAGSSQTVTVAVNPKPSMTSASTATICSGTTVTIPLTSDVASSYLWSAANNVNTTGEDISSQTTSTISNTIINNSSLAQNVVYTVTPTSTTGTCAGTAQTLTVTVNPAPTIINSLNASICSGGTVGIPLISNINSTFSWIATDNINTTGESITAQTRDTLINTIVNNLSNVQNVVYTVTPTSIANGCVGGGQTISVLVNPLDNANFSYSTGTYCQSGNYPSALITGLTGGTFSSTSGLIFLNTYNGLINLSASTLGSYTITYTTNSSCSNSSTFNLTITTAPSASFSYTGTPYCSGASNPLPLFGTGASAGVFSANPSGLSFVSTVTGRINLTGSIPGTYTITNYITAGGGCSSDIATFPITINALPVVNFSGLAANYYYNDASASLIGTPAGGSFSGTGISGNSFSPAVAGGGTFPISYFYTDGNGCANTSPSHSTIVTARPAPPSICEVTVDEASVHNIIYWDKTPYTRVDSFIVYREITNNNYQRVGALKDTALSEFVDTTRHMYFPNTGDPNAGTFRYKLQIKDSLGNYSPLSDYHNTIYISQNYGTFSWNHYGIEGQPLPLPSGTLVTYDLWRDDNNNGNWHIVNSVAGSQQTQTDVGWNLTLQSTASWRVATNWNITCNPTRAVINISHSNIRHPGIIITGIDHPDFDNVVSVYPNPANDRITFQLGIGMKAIDMRIYNVVGELVYQSEITNQQTTIDISSFAKGVYTVQVENKDAKVFKKLVVQ